MDIKNIPTGGTRLKWLLALTVLATVGWVLSIFGYVDPVQAVSFESWAEFEKWLFISYGATEVGSKYSHAVMNK